MAIWSGMNTNNVLAQILNFSILLVWIILGIYCLIKLRNLLLPAIAKVIWALMIVIIPLFGSIAFLIVKPGEENQQKSQ